MDCACVFVDVDDPISNHKESNPIARVQHKCGECGRIINPGEKYHYETGLFDNKWNSYKTCLDCKSIRDAFFCDGWFYGQILDDLYEHIDQADGQISSNCILDLTPGAQDIVFKFIELVWAELNDLEGGA